MIRLRLCDFVVFVVMCLSAAQSGPALGAGEHDLELTIRCDKKELKRGDEIPIVFTIRNSGKNAFEYDDRNDDRSGRMDECRLSARRADGAVVADPRADYEGGLWGGLSSGSKRLGSGKFFTKTIALNRWASLKEAGRYTVTGIYQYNVPDEEASERYGTRRMRAVGVESTPIEIVVGERSDREMGDYIRRLSEELNALDESNAQGRSDRRENAIARLVYTGDGRIVPILIDLTYSENRDNGSFWAWQGFLFYLPRNDQIKAQLAAAARERGLIGPMQSFLEKYGCGADVFAMAIPRSLESENERVLNAGVTAAQDYPDDSYMDSLIRIATDSNSPARSAAIYSVAYNRTDEGVAVLKRLLEDKSVGVSSRARYAIGRAYQRHPVHPEQIDNEYTAILTNIARDMNDTLWPGAVSQIVLTRTEQGIAALQAYLDDPAATNPMMDSDEGLRTIRELLRDDDPEMRQATERFVRRLSRVQRGRALRATDFGPEFQGWAAKQKKAMLRKLEQRAAAAKRPSRWAKKIKLQGVGNFHKVSDILYRGEQPTKAGMKALEKMGIKTAVNLRSFHSDRDEMKGTKMLYEHITMKAWQAEDKEIERFLKIVTSKNSQPVFVHCQYGADRTGTMCALYRIAVQGWTKDQAIEEMTKGGYGYHSIWENLINYIKALDIEKIKQKAGLKN